MHVIEITPIVKRGKNKQNKKSGDTLNSSCFKNVIYIAAHK